MFFVRASAFVAGNAVDNHRRALRAFHREFAREKNVFGQVESERDESGSFHGIIFCAV
jgi:predicted choloylglycine hydrolase